jgi:hypothetical protein
VSTAAPAVHTRPLPFSAVLWRGLAAGAAGGLAASLVSLLVVERPLKAALAVEEKRAAAGEVHAELFGRTTQIIGGMIAELAVATVIGLIFAVVFARTRHVLPVRTDFGRAVLLAATGFGAVALLPGLKYPANPPSVGDPATITQRTLLYLAFLGSMLVVAYFAFAAQHWLAARGWAPAHRNAAVTAGTAVAVAVLALAFPAPPDAIPADLPATVLWQFRIASLGLLAALWSVLGLAMGLLLTPRPGR